MLSRFAERKRKKEKEYKKKKTVSSTVFDRGFPVGRRVMLRRELEMSPLRESP